MGAVGSKEKLSQIVVVYGCNCKDFNWKDDDDRNVYHAGGTIINCGSKKYVITTRSRLIGCNNLVMYHSYFNENNAILRNDLYVIFQSMEYNIIILATIGKTELDLSVSEIISGEYNNTMIADSYDILNKKLVIPTPRSHYYTTIMDLDLEAKAVKYRVDIYDAKFGKAFVFDQTFLPANYLYEFKIDKNNKTPLFGIYGAVIYNKKLNLIGMVTEVNNNILYVLPTKVLHKVVYDFINYYDNPGNYHGPRMLPFNFRISKKLDIKILKIDSAYNKKIMLKENDKILSINGKEVLVVKKNKNYDFEIPNIPYVMPSFPLTSQPYYFPKSVFPYLNINGIIIVELTHELIDMIVMHDIKLKNNLVADYLESKMNTYCRYLIIIDCLNIGLAKEYNLPQWELDKKQNIICPTIKTINQKLVSTLDDVQNNILQIADGKYNLQIGLPDGSTNEINI